MTYSSKTQPKRREIADMLGVTVNRVSQLTKAGMPRDSVEAAVGWYRLNIDKKAPSAHLDENGNQRPLAELRAELLCLQIERARQDVGLREREVVPIDELKRILSLYIDSFQKGYSQLEYWLNAKFQWGPEDKAAVSAKWRRLEAASHAEFAAALKQGKD